MDETFAAEAGRLDRSDGPVEGDGLAILELCVGVLHDFGGDEVEGAVDVFLAILVEDAPGTACISVSVSEATSRPYQIGTLRHALDLWKAVEVRDVGHIVGRCERVFL